VKGGYLTVIEVLSIHSIMINEFGGTDGVRDMGALESAVFRPQTGYYDDPVAEAAAFLESLIQNHPFLDGNKRTAVATGDVHLRMNGMELGGDSLEHHRFIIGQIESGNLDRSSLEEWLRESVELSMFGAAPTATAPPRDEWDRDDIQRKMGRDLASPATEKEAEWLEANLE
jgi:death-on-curing protein